MRRFRLRLSWLLWLVAIVAAFLAGIRYGEYREAAFWNSSGIHMTKHPVQFIARPIAPSGNLGGK